MTCAVWIRQPRSFLSKVRGVSYSLRMSAVRFLPLALVLANLAGAQQSISFPTQDGGRICAELYSEGSGKSDRAVVLAHGGRFNKESWRIKARTLLSAGFAGLGNRLPRVRLLQRSGSEGFR